ncbi:Aste57867_18776 [Aphanomyces stellatus]|uniref:Aste57867_18776 protein n=1 Tax=Aphanomyces stellatus TaxID=120398 RepID=A0A485LCP4_9STRA|nr:hypothetical protein As57867_018712 [Aphanomyces stellatus]VFT95510.1 Aste57867_18776 [Aphanomyces stellatus]
MKEFMPSDKSKKVVQLWRTSILNTTSSATPLLNNTLRRQATAMAQSHPTDLDNSVAMNANIPKDYGRGEGYPWKFGDALNDSGMILRCERDKGKGNCESCGQIIYPKCASGYAAISCKVCRAKTTVLLSNENILDEEGVMNPVFNLDDTVNDQALVPYGRGTGYPWKFGDRVNYDGQFNRCQADNGKGKCELCGANVYLKCKSGYTATPSAPSSCVICYPTAHVLAANDALALEAMQLTETTADNTASVATAAAFGGAFVALLTLFVVKMIRQRSPIPANARASWPFDSITVHITRRFICSMQLDVSSMGPNRVKLNSRM